MPRLVQTRRQLLIRGSATIALASPMACGYLLYPERRGRAGGHIDTTVLIIDLLWLLPGVLPGVICLVVDFASGCIYGGDTHLNAAPARKADGAPIAVATLSVDGATVATGVVDSNRQASLAWEGPLRVETVRAHGRLVVRDQWGRTAEAAVGALVPIESDTDRRAL